MSIEGGSEGEGGRDQQYRKGYGMVCSNSRSAFITNNRLMQKNKKNIKYNHEHSSKNNNNNKRLSNCLDKRNSFYLSQLLGFIPSLLKLSCNKLQCITITTPSAFHSVSLQTNYVCFPFTFITYLHIYLSTYLHKYFHCFCTRNEIIMRIICIKFILVGFRFASSRILRGEKKQCE